MCDYEVRDIDDEFYITSLYFLYREGSMISKLVPLFKDE
jgi:hypothetical protein